MVKLEVFDPSGFTESAKPSLYAPRLPDLNGKTICELSNGSGWEINRTFPLIRQLLKRADFPISGSFLTLNSRLEFMKSISMILVM